MAKKNSHARKMRVQARAQALGERPCATWQEDVAWLRQGQMGEGKPSIPVVMTLLERHPRVDEALGESLLAWLGTGNPDRQAHPSAWRSPSTVEEMARTLGRAAWEAGRFAWCTWAIDASPTPETTLRLLVVECRGAFPRSHTLEAMAPQERAAWDGLWWRMAQQCGQWGPGYGFFELGLRFFWPPKHMDLDALSRVVEQAQTGLDKLPAWRREEQVFEVLADMKRVLLGAHVARHEDADPTGKALAERRAKRRAM